MTPSITSTIVYTSNSRPRPPCPTWIRAASSELQHLGHNVFWNILKITVLAQILKFRHSASVKRSLRPQLEHHFRTKKHFARWPVFISRIVEEQTSQMTSWTSFVSESLYVVTSCVPRIWQINSELERISLHLEWFAAFKFLTLKVKTTTLFHIIHWAVSSGIRCFTLREICEYTCQWVTSYGKHRQVILLITLTAFQLPSSHDTGASWRSPRKCNIDGMPVMNRYISA